MLNDTGINVVTAFNAAEIGITIIVQVNKLVFELTNDFVDLVANWARIDFDVVVNARQFAKELLRDFAVGRNDDFSRLSVHYIERNFLVEEDIRKGCSELIMQFFLALIVVLYNHLLLTLGFRRSHLAACDFFFRRDFDVHDNAVCARRNCERGVFDVSGFFTEDRTKKSFFRGEFGFALRRDFANKDIARLNFSTDADNTICSEVLEGLFTDVRNVACDFLWSKFGVTSADLKLIDVNRGIDVLFHNAFGDHDGVFEVVSIPWHECHEYVTT